MTASFFSPPPEDPAELMIRRQLVDRGIRDAEVLAAIASVPRELFVEAECRIHAHDDSALPIACGQTISQPYIVALMTEALQLDKSHRVLELGTGSGYQTAILGRLAAEVISVERHAKLSRQAAHRLAELKLTNVRLLIGDGWEGAPEYAPFDRAIITAAAPHCPPAVWEQLREGGLLVAPIGDDEQQMLVRQVKLDGQAQTQRLCACRFVPLVHDPQ